MVVSLLCAVGCTPPSLAPRGDLGAPGPERPPAVLLPPEVSATPNEITPCVGETAIPPAIDTMLTSLESPERGHCERHRLTAKDAPLLFVRTMNTVAHDDEGNGSPACTWEVFRVHPPAHVGTLSWCTLRFENGCIVSMDDPTLGALKHRMCLANGTLPPYR